MMKKELGSEDIKVVATGVLSSLIHSETDSIDHIDKFLTFEGLRLIHLKISKTIKELGITPIPFIW